MEPWLETTIGIIMMFTLGPAVGNYATSVVYRLPFGQTPFEKNPYCGDCGTMLAPKDLFPIWSYVFSRGKCQYCGVQIRPSYTVIEVVCGIIFIWNYLLFGISEGFILITTYAVFLVILAGLEYHENKLFTLILTYLFGIAAIMRVIDDGSIYGFFYSGFAMLFVGAIIWRGSMALTGKTIECPPYIWLGVLIGITLPLNQLVVASVASVLLYVLMRQLSSFKAQSIPVSVAIYLALLYPHYADWNYWSALIQP
ncbi:MAG: prepilin peptidase [Rickettsiales bacterium]|nr:prepilin peptidase [Rickettsiales bacterium]